MPISNITFSKMAISRITFSLFQGPNRLLPPNQERMAHLSSTRSPEWRTELLGTVVSTIQRLNLSIETMSGPSSPVTSH